MAPTGSTKLVLNVGVKPPTTTLGIQKGWTPNYNSTCMVVPDKELDLFESEILHSLFFGKQLADIPNLGPDGPNRHHSCLREISSFTVHREPARRTLSATNTWSILQNAPAALSKEDFAAELVADLAWWQVITVVMLDSRPVK